MGEPGSKLVLVTFHDPLLNGATISALRAIPVLEQEGWRFAFWVPAPGPCFDWLAERGAEVRGRFRPVVSGLRPLFEPPGPARRLAATPPYLTAFARTLRDLRPELVHANSLFSYAEALTARALGVPAFLHVHDMAPAGKADAVRAICRRGVTVCAAVSRACVASYAHDGWQPELVYEAAPVPAERVDVRERPEPFVVGTVGVVARRKGADTFVEAAAKLERDHPGRFDFRMVGSPNDPLERMWGEDVIAEARRVGVEHLPEADVYAELRSWDAFVLASRMDPCPIVMLEAMASGLPVIGSTADGIPEEVTPECGLLVPPSSPEALAGAISEIAELDAGQRRQMGDEGRARVERAFSVERQAEDLGGLYRQCLDPSGGDA